MTREEAINEIKSWDFLNEKESEAVQTLIPELSESEGERIRKYLIGELKTAKSVGELKFIIPQPTREECIAYLEKQKEQKPVDIAPNQFDGITYGMQGYSTEKPVERDLTVFEGVLDTFLFNFAHSPIEDCEPKEYIKKYSSEILKAAYKELQSELKHDLFEAKQEGRKEGYEAGVYETEQKQKPAVTHGETYHVDTLGTQQVIAGKMPQKPAEWSEEDERMLSRCEKSIESSKQFADSDTFKKAKDNEIDWLENRFKSLRPQPHWKPSEEQMNALVSARFLYRDGLENSETASALESLCVDLNKLRYGSTK